MITPFSGLRRALEEQREQIDQRIEAIVMAEAALTRVADAFGMPAGADRGAPGREGAPTGTTPPSDPASPVLDGSAPKRSACRECEECSEPFAPARRGGQAQPFCSKRCRQRARARRRQPGKPNGRAGSGAVAKRGAARSADAPAPEAAPVAVDLALALGHGVQTVAAEVGLAWKDQVTLRNRPALGEGRGDHRATERDRAGDERFVKAVVPMLGAEARARAELVRLSPGDPVRALLEA